jgi:hypothetical protein
VRLLIPLDRLDAVVRGLQQFRHAGEAADDPVTWQSVGR